MAEDTTKELLVRVSATTELLRSQLTAAEREIDGFAKKASAANDNIDRSFKRGAVSAGQMRFAMRDLSMQIGDVGTQFALGARPMQIFASQGSQVASAIGLMAGEATALGRFLGGPWFQILTTAAIVLGPMVAKLFEGEGAMKAVTAASNGLGDAQSVLAGIFDMTTGKIKSQNEMLLLNARIQAINLRAEAAAKGEAGRTALGEGLKGRESIDYQLTNPFRSRDRMNYDATRARNLQKTIANVQAGRTTYSQAAKWAEQFDFTGLTLDRGGFLQAISDTATAEGKRRIADLIDNSLNTGRLDSGLRTSAAGRTGSRPRAGSSAASGTADRFNGLDAFVGDNNRDLYRESQERMRLLNKTNADQWDAQMQAIRQQREYDYQLMEDNLRKMDRLQAAQLQTLSGLYESLFRGGTRAIWDDFGNIGRRVVSQVLAQFTLSLFKKGGSGGGFDLGSAATAAFKSILGFADGGRPPIGRVSMVGERGPELFVPDVAGTIIPNHALGGKGVVVNISAPGATAETISAIRREIFNAMPMIAAATTGNTIRSLNRRTL